MEKRIYGLAIQYLKDFFPNRFENLIERRKKLGIKEKQPLRKYGFESSRNISLETELETDCNSFIYDYCFSNKVRFKLFSKQFSSEDKFAESIALQALTKNFNKNNVAMNELENAKNDIKENEQKLSRKSKPEDESYKRNMSFIKRILNENLSKYKVVKEFCDRNKGRINVSEKSLANTFDVFLKNHKEEILSGFQLNEDEFNKYFFPKKYSKR